MTIRVSHASDEEEALEKVQNQYKGFSVLFLKKVKKEDEKDGYFYWFTISDQEIL